MGQYPNTAIVWAGGNASAGLLLMKRIGIAQRGSMHPRAQGDAWSVKYEVCRKVDSYTAESICAGRKGANTLSGGDRIVRAAKLALR